MMKLGERLDMLTDDYLQFHQQLGIRHCAFLFWDMLMSEPGARGAVKADAVAELQRTTRRYGIEPYCFLLPQGRNTQYWHARFGRSDEAEVEIENVCESIRVLGDAGVRVIEWTWSIPDCFGRWGGMTVGRGGARVVSFDYDLIKDKRPGHTVDMDAEQMWNNLIYFMERIMPVAERAGVQMAMHHHDPPCPWLAGEERILSNFEGMKRMIEEVDSPVNGFNICMGTLSEQAGVNVLEVLRYLGGRSRINHVHFRNVKGSVPVYDEAFIDDGDVDMYQAMKIFRKTGYQHLFISDHCPGLAGLERPASRLASRAFAVGYTKALIHAAESEYAAEQARLAGCEKATAK